MIEQRDDGFYLLSKKTGKNLGGPYKNREDAVARERQVQFFKHQSAVKAAVEAGRGMPNFNGGGQGTYTKLPSLGGQAKADLTNATKDIGENAPQDEFSQQFPATAAYYRRRDEINGLAAQLPAKQADVTLHDVRSATGYGPGTWYGQDTFSPANQTRVGNLITGTALTGLGLAAIPLAQHLWPNRFRRKGKGLAALAVLGGMSAPWLMNAPSTMRDVGLATDAMFAPKAAADKTAGVPYGLPIGKTYMAKVLMDQLQSGNVDYGQAAGLLQSAVTEAPNRPWVTVGDLARAAVGAGAGALAGSVAAKGIGLFMNISPKEQRYMTGTAAGLGALINLGKIGL